MPIGEPIGTIPDTPGVRGIPIALEFKSGFPSRVTSLPAPSCV
jgi:hypothetical protein